MNSSSGANQPVSASGAKFGVDTSAARAMQAAPAQSRPAVRQRAARANIFGVITSFRFVPKSFESALWRYRSGVPSAAGQFAIRDGNGWVPGRGATAGLNAAAGAIFALCREQLFSSKRTDGTCWTGGVGCDCIAKAGPQKCHNDEAKG